MEKLSNLVMGSGSVALIGDVPQLTASASLDVPGIVQTIIQLIVGVATLLAMFKKKPQVIN